MLQSIIHLRSSREADVYRVKLKIWQLPHPQKPQHETGSLPTIHSPKPSRSWRACVAPDGCPWDREQTFDSIKRHTLEETYEVFDAIERRAWPDLKDELGDLLLQVLFYAQMASEAGYFTIRTLPPT